MYVLILFVQITSSFVDTTNLVASASTFTLTHQQAVIIILLDTDISYTLPDNTHIPLMSFILVAEVNRPGTLNTEYLDKSTRPDISVKGTQIM